MFAMHAAIEQSDKAPTIPAATLGYFVILINSNTLDCLNVNNDHIASNTGIN
jgi:hypothetical protein